MVTLYSKNACAQCMGTKMYLKSKGIEFVEKNIDDQPEAKDEVLKYGFTSAPIIVPGDEYGLQAWSGFRPDELAKLIQE